MNDGVKSHCVRRVVSGGQTGVDRAALDVAVALGLEHGGWCPRGRLAEDGTIPARYSLRETDSDEYPIRTECNVVDSDGTLILFFGVLSGGTELTHRLAIRHGKPIHLVDLANGTGKTTSQQWLSENAIRILNVAGPRESSTPGIGDQAHRFLLDLLG